MARKLVSNSKNPSRLATRIQQLLLGFSKLPPTEQFDVLGTVEAAPALTTELKGLLAPFTASDDADRAAEKARKARDAGEAATIARVDAIDEAVRSHYGSKNKELTNFGLKPRATRKKPTASQRANTAAKAKATKDARKAALNATGTPKPTQPPTTK